MTAPNPHVVHMVRYTVSVRPSRTRWDWRCNCGAGLHDLTHFTQWGRANRAAGAHLRRVQPKEED